MKDPAVPATPDLPRISDYPGHWAQRFPKREALVLNRSRITYALLSALVDRCAAALVGKGVMPGDRVAMLSTPRPEFLIVFLATARIGAVWLGLNPKYTLGELKYVVGDAQPVLLIAPAAIEGRPFRDQAQELAREFPSIRETIILDLTDEFVERALQPLMAPAAESMQARIDGVKTPDAAVLVYTSGTTGQPKGALLPHRGLVHCSRIQRDYLRAEPLRVLNNLPVNHVGCVGDICSYTLVSGGAIVFAERFDPASIGPLLLREKVTMWGQVPTMFQLTLDHPDFHPSMAAHVQEIAWSGAMCPEDLARRLQAICPTLRSFYGMTETVGSVVYSDPDASLDDLVRTIGKPDPRYDVRIAGPDGQPVRRGDAGEIQVRGDFLMKGYLNKPDATRQAFTPDGWLRTGDAAVEEDDGQYRLIGRLREMFKSGGYNVYPREIEIALEAHPAVATVAVIATPDRLYGEVGTAFYVTKPGHACDETALRSFCRERLANYKVPKYFRALERAPMLPIGKIDRAELKREASRLASIS
jgi:acyl-CoA synthetase (AMP-forming)/AMP-acid ligase II